MTRWPQRCSELTGFRGKSLHGWLIFNPRQYLDQQLPSHEPGRWHRLQNSLLFSLVHRRNRRLKTEAAEP